MEHPTSWTHTVTTWKKSLFNLRNQISIWPTIFHYHSTLSQCVRWHLIQSIIYCLLRYENWSTNYRGLPYTFGMALFSLKHMNCFIKIHVEDNESCFFPEVTQQIFCCLGVRKISWQALLTDFLKVFHSMQRAQIEQVLLAYSLPNLFYKNDAIQKHKINGSFTWWWHRFLWHSSSYENGFTVKKRVKMKTISRWKYDKCKLRR